MKTSLSKFTLASFSACGLLMAVSSQASIPPTSATSWMTVQSPVHFAKPIVSNGTRCVSNFNNMIAGQYPTKLSTNRMGTTTEMHIEFVNQKSRIDCVKQASAKNAEPSRRDIEADLVKLGIWI